MTNEPSPRQWRVNGHSIEANDPDGLWLQNEKTGWGVVANLPSCPKSRMSVKNRKTWDAIVEANAALIVDAVNERDKLKAECDRLRSAYADLWRAVKRIEADSRLGLGTGPEVASSALHYVHTYASSAIRAAEKKGFAPAIGEDKP
jgi:hypothetical protein